MKYKTILLMMYTLCTIPAHPQHTKLPSISTNRFLVTDLGAVGDGKTLNTKNIQQALDKAGIDGGTVIIPKGVFLCGPLNMYGKTHLEIQKGAILRLRNDVDSFPSVKERYLNFIHISKATDIKISGEGTIDGQGDLWWKKFTAKEISFRRPQMMFIEQSERIEISGITFLNPPNTHLSIKSSVEVYIHDITIQAPPESRNTDGINISAKNCTIEKCRINTGDDNIAINFGNTAIAGEPECKNILIKDCFFGQGHGLSIGSFTSGGLKNLLVTDCRFDGTTSAIRIKTARGRGGMVEDISYNNIDIRNCRWPIFISAYYPKEPATPAEDSAAAITDKTPVYRNITLKNVTVTNATEALKIWGIPESPVDGIRFENVHISAKTGALIYNAKGIVFIKSTITATTGELLKTFRSDIKGL